MNQKSQLEEPMDFTVREWMITLIVYVDPDATVKQALSLMRRRYIHSLIVQKSEKNPEYGIITSTDISDKIIASHHNPAEMLVRDIMTTPITTVTESTSLQECAQMMKKLRVHHLPVTSDAGELIGMISATDFLVVAEAMST
jgi:CBS domain-containing protein